MPLWDSHPRVFLDVVNESEAMCPYCGTRYRLKRGAHVHAHGFDTRELHQDRRYDAPADPRAAAAPGYRHDASEVGVDALGNTTLEQMTHWLRRGR